MDGPGPMLMGARPSPENAAAAAAAAAASSAPRGAARQQKVQHLKAIEVEEDVRCMEVVGESVWVAHRDGTVHFRDVQLGVVTDSAEWRQRSGIFRGKGFASTTWYDGYGPGVWVGWTDGSVTQVSAADGRTVVQKGRAHREAVRCVTGDAASARLWTSGGADRTVWERDAATGAVLRQLAGVGDAVNTVAFHAASASVLVGSREGIRAFPVGAVAPEAGAEPLEGALLDGGHRGNVRALLPVGDNVWSAGDDGQICVWAGASGAGGARFVRSMKAHPGAVFLLRLVEGDVWSVGKDGVAVWDQASGARTGSVDVPSWGRSSGAVTEICSSDGRVWLSTRNPAALHVFRVAAGRAGARTGRTGGAGSGAGAGGAAGKAGGAGHGPRAGSMLDQVRAISAGTFAHDEGVTPGGPDDDGMSEAGSSATASYADGADRSFFDEDEDADSPPASNGDAPAKGFALLADVSPRSRARGSRASAGRKRIVGRAARPSAHSRAVDAQANAARERREALMARSSGAAPALPRQRAKSEHGGDARSAARRSKSQGGRRTPRSRRQAPAASRATPHAKAAAKRREDARETRRTAGGTDGPSRSAGGSVAGSDAGSVNGGGGGGGGGRARSSSKKRAERGVAAGGSKLSRMSKRELVDLLTQQNVELQGRQAELEAAARRIEEAELQNHMMAAKYDDRVQEVEQLRDELEEARDAEFRATERMAGGVGSEEDARGDAAARLRVALQELADSETERARFAELCRTTQQRNAELEEVLATSTSHLEVLTGECDRLRQGGAVDGGTSDMSLDYARLQRRFDELKEELSEKEDQLGDLVERDFVNRSQVKKLRRDVRAFRDFLAKEREMRFALERRGDGGGGPPPRRGPAPGRSAMSAPEDNDEIDYDDEDDDDDGGGGGGGGGNDWDDEYGNGGDAPPPPPPPGEPRFRFDDD